MADLFTNNEPHIVRVKDFKIDADYVAWLSEIKQRYHSAQIKAAVKVNSEKLAFNWSAKIPIRSATTILLTPPQGKAARRGG